MFPLAVAVVIDEHVKSAMVISIDISKQTLAGFAPTYTSTVVALSTLHTHRVALPRPDPIPLASLLGEHSRRGPILLAL